ncbi:hypothetical protein [Vibrio vulnificus]|uniref:hypothetical protein n=1 Tax=Vibrio vulnificus TaxID=672 RepID=UPI0021117E7E|nr:hypothetical protein [Vibrio vulnificus]
MRQTHQQRYSQINTQHIAATPPLSSFPCTRETIYPHAPGAAFENALTAMGNNIEQPNSNTGNEAVIPSHTTCCTMGPRVREDDKIRDRKRLKDRS